MSIPFPQAPRLPAPPARALSLVLTLALALPGYAPAARRWARGPRGPSLGGPFSRSLGASRNWRPRRGRRQIRRSGIGNRAPATVPHTWGDLPSELVQELDQAGRQLLDPSGAEGAPAVILGWSSPGARGLRGYGEKVPGGRVPPDQDTAFGIGSVSKLLGGLLLAREVVGGQRSLEEPVSGLLAPDLAGQAPWTLGELVAHRSGLPPMPPNLLEERDEDGDGVSDPLPWMPARHYTRELLGEALGELADQTPEEAPYQYSNLGTGLLALALADAAGVADVHTHFTRELFVPLGMTRTGMCQGSFPDRLGENQASGQHYREGSLREVDFSDMGVLAGAGEVVTTPRDLLVLLDHLSGRARRSPLAQAAEEMLRPLGSGSPGKDMGYSVDLDPEEDGSPVAYKGGSVAGFSAFVVWDREARSGLVCLTNRGGLSSLRETCLELFRSLRDRER